MKQLAKQLAKQQEAQILLIMLASLGLSALLVTITNFNSDSLNIQTLGMGHNILAIVFILFEPRRNFVMNLLSLAIGLSLFAILYYCLHVSFYVAVWAILARVVYGFFHILKDEFQFLKYSQASKSLTSPFFLKALFISLCSGIGVKTFGILLRSATILSLGNIFFYVSGSACLIWLIWNFMKREKSDFGFAEKLYFLYFFGLLFFLGAMNLSPKLQLNLIAFALVHHIVAWYLIYLHRVFHRRGKAHEVSGPRWMRHVKTQPLLFLGLVLVINGLYFYSASTAIGHGWLKPTQLPIGESLSAKSWSASSEQPFYLLAFDVLAYHAFGIVHNTLSWRVWLKPPVV